MDMGDMKRIFLAVALTALVGCSAGDPKDFEVTEAGIKGLATRIKKVEITPQLDPGLFYVQITMEKDPFTGGAQDWNSIASDVHSLSQRLLTKPSVTRARFEYVSPQNGGKAWAAVQWKRKDIPENWKELTYLQFFGVADPLPSGMETARWLCEFYAKYESAAPSSIASRCKP